MSSGRAFSGVIPAMAVPFRDDGKLGVTAVMTNGHTGEVGSLLPEERAAAHAGADTVDVMPCHMWLRFGVKEDAVYEYVEAIGAESGLDVWGSATSAPTSAMSARCARTRRTSRC